MASVTHSENVPMKAMLCDLRGRQGAMVKLLGEFVGFESPSHVKSAVDECAAIVAREWQGRGTKVRILRQRERGNHVRAEIWDGAGRASGQIMVLGHTDRCIRSAPLRRCRFGWRKGALGGRDVR